jgi:hypothetical protein
MFAIIRHRKGDVQATEWLHSVLLGPDGPVDVPLSNPDADAASTTPEFYC